MMKNYIRQVIELFSQNDYPVSVQKQFRHWLADEEHKEEKMEALASLWEEAGQQRVPQGMQQSIRRMQQNIGMRPVSSQKKYILRIWQVASVLLLAVSSVSIYLLLEKDDFSSDLIECHIPTAEIHELTLPDGTSVMLNSKSTLFYPESFNGKTRSVYLIGEGYFKVMPDKEHPFIVKGSDFQVTALGTEFNVNTYSVNDEVYTTLVSGSVKVEYDNLISSVILKPNQQLSYNKLTKKSRLQQSQVDDVIAWQRGELVFSDAHLEDIFTRLEHKYPYTFVYSFHSLNNNTYSFRFPKNVTLEEIMLIISQVVGDIHYVIKDNKCYITN